MMQRGKSSPALWGAVLLLTVGIFCPLTVAVADDAGGLTPLAMGGRIEKPAATEAAPKVAQPTLLIRIGAAHFDPLYKMPANTASLPVIQAYEASASGYYVVQFDGPVTASWKTALQQAGAEIFDYVPDYAFVVRMSSARVDAVRAMAHVRWVGIFQPSYRISQKALGLMYTQSAAEVAAPVTLRVNVFPGVDLAAIQARIQSLGGDIKEQSSTALKTTLKVEIPASSISSLPSIEGVKWVEPAPKWKLHNNVSTDVMNVRAARDTQGLYGSGQTVCVADTGLDQGSATPTSLHDDFEDGSGGSRVIAILDVAGDGNTSDTHGHGTHVAGSVLGNGAMSGSNPAVNSFPPSAVAGIAPKANLVFQALMRNSDGAVMTPVDLNLLFGPAESAGADLHTNSWGSSDYGEYTTSSQDVDEYIWNHKDFLILFSAGNSGVDMDADGVIDLYSISSPSTAKNCLSVGASEGDRPTGAGYDTAWGSAWPASYPAAPIAGDHMSDNDRGICAFSSRGPTKDGRHKPDLVAPGSNILSARSAVGGDGWGAYAPNSSYVWMGGTSMSNPLSAGAAALMREYLINEAGFDPPSAALIKAALINSAEDIEPGQFGLGADQEIPDGPVPNAVEGWGRLNLGDGVYPTGSADIFYYEETAGLDTGESNSYSFAVTDAGAPLKVNLVWSDYPGSPSVQGGLVNDLDLEVIGPGATIHYADNASQKATVTTLSYDADAPETALGGATSFATRFTPASYPARVDSVSVFAANNAPGENIDVVVYDDGGGVPGTVLYTKSVPYLPTEFVTIPIEGVTIGSGDFFVGIVVTNLSFQGMVADTTDSGGRTFHNAGGSWTSTALNSWYVRANMASADYSTNYDRVNNTLGVTLATPAVGSYTVRVAGHNVPQGPQPYAVVASGNIQEFTGGALQFDAATYLVSEDGTTATINVTRTSGDDGAVSVNYATTNGTATAGSDYTAASGTLNWTDGDSDSKSFTVPIINDTTGEDDETVTLTLSGEAGGATLGAIASAVLTIEDDEAGVVQFDAASYTIRENRGPAAITVERTNGTSGSISVTCTTSDGTATAGSDYTAASGTLTLADGETSGTFNVAIIDDSDEESDETITLTLSGDFLGSPGTVTLTIRDNDGDSGGGGGGGGCFMDTAAMAW